MYRILIHKSGMAKDTYTFLTTTKENTTTDDTGTTTTKVTEIFETVDLDVLKSTYEDQLGYQTTSQLLPIEVLSATLGVEIEDSTTP